MFLLDHHVDDLGNGKVRRPDVADVDQIGAAFAAVAGVAGIVVRVERQIAGGIRHDDGILRVGDVKPRDARER